MTDAVLIPPAPAPPQTRSTLLFLFNVRRNVLGAFSEAAYDDLTVRGRLLGREMMLMSDPAGIRRVLVENALNYVKPTAGVRIIKPFTGDGLLTTEGDVWRGQRRRVAHAFTPASVGALIPRFHDASDGLLRRLDGQDRVDLSGALEDGALDAVTQALFSGTGEDRRHRLNALARGYLNSGRGPGRPTLLDLIAQRPDDFAAFGRRRRDFQRRWFAEVDAVIASRRAGPSPGTPDLLDNLLSARDPSGEPIGDGEVRSQVATFLAAGFETTARLMFWTAYMLALDPVEQARVRDELLASPSPVASLDDLARWPRMRCVLQETLRLYPTAPIIARRALADDEVAGEPVRAGGQVTITPWVVHRHRRLWDEPAAFRPERFEGRPNAHLQGGAYLPFSLGPRVCIGAAFAMTEATIILAGLLGRYRLELDSDRPVMPVAAVSIQPGHAPLFRLTPVRSAAGVGAPRSLC